MSRYSDVDLDNLTPEQQAVADSIAAGPRGSLRGPFIPWMLSPELADRAQALGEYLRFRSSLPDRLKELAILFTARHWDADFEWWAHAQMAEKAGLSRTVIEAIASGEMPTFDHPDEALIWQICTELYETRRLSEETFRQAEDQFGQHGVAELVGVLGYYVMVSLTLNLFGVAAPKDDAVPHLSPLPRPGV